MLGSFPYLNTPLMSNPGPNCFGDVSDRDIRGSSPPSTAVPGPVKGALHSSQLHTKCILLYARPVLGQPKSDYISYAIHYVPTYYVPA